MTIKAKLLISFGVVLLMSLSVISLVSESELEQRAIKEEFMASVSDDNFVNESDHGTDDCGLREKYNAYVAEEERLNKRDLSAYPILAKYYGDEYDRTSLIHDYDTDVPYMLQMVKLLESQSATEDEVEILKLYLSRRVELMTDESLISTINSTLDKIK